MPEFPAELLNEARKHPGGWVYEIDERYERHGAVPVHAIRRAWRVKANGEPSSESQENPNFGRRRPLRHVEQVIAEAKALAGSGDLRLLVAHQLFIGGMEVDFDVGMVVVVDAVLAMGFVPADPWMSFVGGGRAYDFRREL